MQTVLVVDDNPKELITFQEWFNVIYNFNVAISSDGEKAINILENGDIGVLCTGIQIPKIDGIELLAYMTRSHPDTPCVVMSEHGVPWFHEKPNRQDALYHIEKPVSPEALTTAIFVGLVLKDEGVAFKGISMRSYLPLVWKGQKSCSLDIESGENEKGYIHFDKGEIVSAGYKNFLGKQAVVEMAGWEGIKLNISDLPEKQSEQSEVIDILEIFDIAWIGERPASFKNSDFFNRSKIKPPPDIDPRPSLIEKTAHSENHLDTVVREAADMLQKVKGFQAIGIFHRDGKIQAVNSVDGFDVDALKLAIPKIQSMTEQPFEVETVGAYQGATLHTNRHTFIFWTTPSDHHLGVILSADSN